MENPFNKLTTLSVLRPKATIASILVITLALASMAQFINFDNSEDAFYPQNDTTELLYEIEERYQASLDFIRVIDEIEERADIDDYEFIFVSVDPDRDTPNRLNSFLSNFNEKIIGLTGDYESLKPVWENFFVHVKSDLIPEQGSYSELDKTKKQNSHDDHDSHHYILLVF